jgi:hypothetical protein
MRFRAGCGLLLLLGGLSIPAVLPAQDSPQLNMKGASFWSAAGGVTAVNVLTWAYNWYVQRWHWAKVGTQSWARNLRDGFVWDNDCFLDNQLAHPYHGSLYHSSARASGYGFWSSIPFVAAGSATWELFGENITASLNDLINTTLGGVALGEVTWRLSSLLGSRRASGPAAVGRELTAFALSPLGRTQGLLRGNSGVSFLDQSSGLSMSVGRRSGHPSVQLGLRYGSPFDPEATRPYDAFEFNLEVSPGAGGGVRTVEITGLLARGGLGETVRSQALLGVFQHYEYQHLPGLELGGHSVSGALLYRHALGERNNLELGAELEGLLLGAISSDQGFEWRRDYDLGPGAGARVNAALARDGREWLRMEGRMLWLHSVHGSGGNHLATIVKVAGAIPLAGPLAVGGDLALSTRHSTYPDFPSTTRRIPEARAYLSWSP